LVLSTSEIGTRNQRGTGQNELTLHADKLDKKGQAAKATWPFCRNNPWTGKFRRRGYFEYP
jgi:hypothetical protein